MEKMATRNTQRNGKSVIQYVISVRVIPMLTNFEEHGFRVTARKLPESCTACPFWCVDLKNLEDGMCYLTGHMIKIDGPQDTQRMDDCIIEQE